MIKEMKEPKVTLTDGDIVTLSGVLTNLRRGTDKNGEGFAAGELVIDDHDEDSIALRWWNGAKCPEAGLRIFVTGKVREYNGQTQIAVSSTQLDPARASGDRISDLLTFWIQCLEAEAAANVRFNIGSDEQLLIESGHSPLHAVFSISSQDESVNQEFVKRCKAIDANSDAQLTIGWPVVIVPPKGYAQGTPEASPLLTTEVQLTKSEGIWYFGRVASEPEINPYALKLLGIGPNERDVIIHSLSASPELAEAGTAAEKSDIILSHLADAEIDLTGINPSALRPVDGPIDQTGLSNTAVLMVGASNNKAITSLIKDLKELSFDTTQLSSGPVAVLLGTMPPETEQRIESHPMRSDM